MSVEEALAMLALDQLAKERVEPGKDPPKCETGPHTPTGPNGQVQCSIRFPWDTQMELTLGEKCYAYSMDGYDIYYLVLQIVTHYHCAIINYQ